MKLQLILIQAEINYEDAHALDPVLKKQLTKALSTYDGQKQSLKSAFENEPLVYLWSVVDADDSEKALYNFWEINADSGEVFFAESDKSTDVVMIHFGFELNPDKANSKSLDHEVIDLLIQQLPNAERIKKQVDVVVRNEKGDVLDFTDVQHIPVDPAAWKMFLKKNTLHESFIEKYQSHFNASCWKWISENVMLSEEAIANFGKKLDWKLASRCQKLPEKIIRQYQKKVDWSWVSGNQNLSEDFIREFQDRLDWGHISNYQKLSENFIREYQEKLNWHSIPNSQVLSEAFIREFKDKVSWKWIATRQVMSESFIEEFMECITDNSLYYKSHLTFDFLKKHLPKFNLDNLVVLDEIPESFLREIKDNFQDGVGEWYNISRYRKNLSISFLKDFEDHIDWRRQSEKYMDEDVLKACKHKIQWYVVLLGNNIKVTESLIMDVIDALSIYDLKLILGKKTKDNASLKKGRQIELSVLNREVLEKKLTELLSKKAEQA